MLRTAFPMWALLFLAACGKSGASKQPPPDPAPVAAVPVKSARVAKLVERMQTHDFEEARAVLDEITALGKDPAFTEAEGVQLLRSTLAPFPKSDLGVIDLPARLVTAATQHPRDSYAAVIEEMFPTWKLRAREAALRQLSTIASPVGTAAFVRVLKAHLADPSVEPGPIFTALEAKPHHATEIVPILMELTKRPAWADDVYLAVLAYCKQGLLQPRLYRGKLDSILAAYRAQRDWLAPKQRAAAPGFVWTEEYSQHRERASVLLDLMQCVPGAETLDELHAALKFQDARLVYFGTMSLLENDVDVPDETYQTIAASPEMRGWLYAELPKHRRGDKFPAKYATQAALAEAEMVSWLVYPTELGRAPDEIRLGKVVTVEGSDYYVYKFRTLGPSTFTANGWMAGVAGPYDHGGAPSAESPGSTFSSFAAYDSLSPEKHVARVTKAIADASSRPR